MQYHPFNKFFKHSSLCQMIPPRSWHLDLLQVAHIFLGTEKMVPWGEKRWQVCSCVAPDNIKHAWNIACVLRDAKQWCLHLYNMIYRPAEPAAILIQAGGSRTCPPQPEWATWNKSTRHLFYWIPISSDQSISSHFTFFLISIFIIRWLYFCYYDIKRFSFFFSFLLIPLIPSLKNKKICIVVS